MALSLTDVLVTGGSGFVGAHIVRRLLEDGPQDAKQAIAYVVSRNPKKKTTDGRVVYHAGDISDATSMAALFKKVKPHVVIHTASPDPLEPAAAQHRTNVDGTNVLLRCATECPESRIFIYTSSDSACEPTGNRDIPVTEDEVKLWDKKHFNNPYGKTKAIADAVVRAANSTRLRTAVLRIPIVYGEDADERNMLPQLMESLRKGEHKMQLGHNTNWFEFCDVTSATEAHLLAAKALLRFDTGEPQEEQRALKVDGEAFFISDGKSRKFFDFARDCYATAGAPVAEDQVKIIPLWMVQMMASAGEWAYLVFTLGTRMPKMRRQSIDHLGGGAHWSIEKARTRLGYEPVISQEEGIKKAVRWAMGFTGIAREG